MTRRHPDVGDDDVRAPRDRRPRAASRGPRRPRRPRSRAARRAAAGRLRGRGSGLRRARGGWARAENTPVMSHHPLVLIVDDSDRNRKLARDVLQRGRVSDARGRDSRRRRSRSPSEHLPDVILMDLRLPDLDGTEAARMLAAEPRTSHIPVVAVTALPLDAGDDVAGRRGLRRLHRQAHRHRRVSRPGPRVLRAALTDALIRARTEVDATGMPASPGTCQQARLAAPTAARRFAESGADAPRDAQRRSRRRRQMRTKLASALALVALALAVVRRQRPGDARRWVRRDHGREGDLRRHHLARARQDSAVLERGHPDAGQVRPLRPAEHVAAAVAAPAGTPTRARASSSSPRAA